MKPLAHVREVIVRFGPTWQETEVLFDGEKQEDILEIRVKRIAPYHDSDITAGHEHGAGTLIEQRTVQAGR